LTFLIEYDINISHFNWERKMIIAEKTVSIVTSGDMAPVNNLRAALRDIAPGKTSVKAEKKSADGFDHVVKVSVNEPESIDKVTLKEIAERVGLAGLELREEFSALVG